MIKINKINPGKKIVLLIPFSLLLSPIFTYAQHSKQNIFSIPEKLPSNVKLTEPKPITYKVTSDYSNQDIYGNFFSKTRVTGSYTRALTNGKSQWNGVHLANSDKKDEAFSEGMWLHYMEGLKYDPTTVMSNAEIFSDSLNANVHAKTLVWDMFTFESFAWFYFDSLKLNIPFHGDKYNKTVSLAGSGSFKNQDVKLTWAGLSRMNGKVCALIQFEAMDNPIALKFESMDAKGRSHYWGDIWVGLADKQLEEVRMNEDVILEIDNHDNNKHLINTIRKITVQKVNTNNGINRPRRQ